MCYCVEMLRLSVFLHGRNRPTGRSDETHEETGETGARTGGQRGPQTARYTQASHTEPTASHVLKHITETSRHVLQPSWPQKRDGNKKSRWRFSNSRSVTSLDSLRCAAALLINARFSSLSPGKDQAHSANPYGEGTPRAADSRGTERLRTKCTEGAEMSS